MLVQEGHKVLISSMGRSGSTWLTDLLNFNNQYQVVFEPFFPARVPEAGAFGYYRYLTLNDQSTQLIENGGKILGGKVKNSWTSRNYKKTNSNKVLIKSIRSNLMLSWINKHFPDVKIILLVRDPFQVAQSWVRLGWGQVPLADESDLDAITSQRDLIEDFPEIMEIFESVQLKNAFETAVLEWCILNYVPLLQRARGECSFHLVNYDDLLRSPASSITEIFEFLEIAVNQNIFQTLDKPSSTSFEKHTKSVKIDDQTRVRSLDIIDRFKSADLRRFVPEADMKTFH